MGGSDVDKPGYRDGRPAGSFRIELHYVLCDDAVVMKEPGDLRGDVGEAKGVLPCGDGRGVALPKGG
jgi:hypothetical protein